MRNLLVLTPLLSLFATGCFIRVPGNDGYYGNNPPPQARPMTYQEAVDRGYGECRSRSLNCRLQNAHLAKNDRVWKVKMKAYNQNRKGHLHLDYDAYSRRLLDADANIRPWRRATPPRWDNENDWDDDNDGIADRKDTTHQSQQKQTASNGNEKDRASNEQQKSGNPKSSAPPQQQKSTDYDDDDDDNGKSQKKGSKQ